MNYETIVLLENISTEDTDSSFSFSDRQKGAGYHNLADNAHTAIYQFDNFKGTVKMQGTLEQFPGEGDWADIDDTEEYYNGTTTDDIKNFTGNYVWIRAAYNLQDGVITSVRYNL